MIREYDPRPPRLSAAACLALAAAAVLLGAPFSPFVLIAGPLALVGFLAGIVRRDGRLVTAGAVVLGIAVLLGGTVAPEPVTVVAAAATALAWDVGHYGLSLGRQVGRGADTARAETIHLGLSAAVAGGATAVVYGVFLAGGTGLPVAAVAALAGGAVLLAGALGTPKPKP